MADHHLDLAAAQAGGDLEPVQPVDLLLGHAQGLGDLRLRDAEQAQHGLLVAGRTGHEGLERGRWPPPAATSTAAHAAGRAGPTTSRRPRHDDPRGGARGLDHRRALGHQRLLAGGGAHGLGVHVGPSPHQRLDDGGDAPLERLVEGQRTAGEARDHLQRQIVRGRPEAAAGHDQVHLLAGQELQLGLHVLGAVAADGDVGQLHAQLQQPVGQPGPVGVRHAAGQHLRTGDHDPRADRAGRAHAQGRGPSVISLAPVR